MQLHMHVATKEQLKRCWAFVVNPFGRRNLDQCTIISCSPQAKVFGIRPGMYYADAKLLIPDLKIIVLNGR